MFFIVGSRRSSKALGRVMHGCMRCQQQSWFTYVRQSSWFTFFFIPVIPLGGATTAVCGSCRFQQVVPNAVADQALAQARMMPQVYPQQQQQQQQPQPQQQQYPYGGAYPPRS